jgi:hypothetical protein
MEKKIEEKLEIRKYKEIQTIVGLYRLAKLAKYIK